VSRQSLHPAEGATLLTNAEWYETRAKYYRATGQARDDEALPLPRPDGYVPARRITRISSLSAGGIAPRRLLYEFDAPADDVTIDLSLYATVERPPGRLVQDPPTSVYDQATRRIVTTPGPQRFVPDPAMSIVVVARPALERGPQGALVTPGAPPPPDIAYYPSPPLADHVGMLAVQKDGPEGHHTYLVRRDGQPISPRGDTAWSTSRWAFEAALIFLPPLVLNAWRAPVPATSVSFEALVPVLVRYPHPWLPDSVFERAGGETVPAMLEETGFVAVRDYRILQTTTVAFPLGDRQGVKELPGPYPQGVVLVSAYTHRDPKDVIEKVGAEIARIPGNAVAIASRIGSTFADVGRAVASGEFADLDRLGAAAIASALVGPAGLALLGSEQPWRDAIRIGATGYALAASPLVAAGERAAAARLSVARAETAGLPSGVGALVRPGVTPMTQPSIPLVGGGHASASDVEAAEVLGRQLMALDPQGAQSLMLKIVREGGFIDLVLARLVIEAEANDAKREALKAEITAVQAEWWAKYGSRIAQAMALVLDVFAPALGQLLFQVVNLLYQAALAAQQLEVALEAERRLERELRAALAADAAADAPPPAAPAPTATPPAPGPAPATPAPPPPWWRPARDWIDREWMPNRR